MKSGTRWLLGMLVGRLAVRWRPVGAGCGKLILRAYVPLVPVRALQCRRATSNGNTPSWREDRVLRS